MDQTILVISCDKTLVDDLSQLVADDQLALTQITPQEAEEDLADHLPVRVVLIDGQLPSAQQHLHTIKATDPDVSIIYMALTYSEEEEIQVRQMAAFYCIIENQVYDNLHRFLMRAST